MRITSWKSDFRHKVAGYCVCLQLENCSPLYYDGSKSWMLIWDDSVPPPSQRNTGSRSWSIVFVEVAVDKIDLGGPSADNRNPKVYLKVSFYMAYDNMTWPPTDFKVNHAEDLNSTRRPNRVLKPCPYYKAGNSTILGLLPLSFCLLIFSMLPGACASEQQNLPGYSLNCRLEMGEYFTSNPISNQMKDQHRKEFNETVQYLVKKHCERGNKTMKINLSTLQGNGSNSGMFQFITTCKFGKSHNEKNVTVQYKFNGRNLTQDEMKGLALYDTCTIEDCTNFSIPEFMKKIEDQGKMLCNEFKPQLIPYLKKGDIPAILTMEASVPSATLTNETTTSVPLAITETTAKLALSTEATTSNPGTENLLTIIALFIAAIIIWVCNKYEKKTCKQSDQAFEKKTCKQSDQAFGKVIYIKADRGQDDVEEAPEQDRVTIHVPIPPNPEIQ